jgi:predicted DNA-binding transcriptional regulator YafY
MSQTRAYNRLLELALVLTAAGSVGVRTDDLMGRLGYDSNESGKRTLIRDLDDLRATGLDIDNVADPGAEARYVIRPGDVRLRVEFTPSQRTALQSALAAASAQGTVALQRQALPVDLDRVREAVRRRCVMYFDYNGKPRAVDPLTWEWSGHDLVVTGLEHATMMIKSFAVVRMEDLEIGEPGSALAAEDVDDRPGLDPITWEVDPPVQAVLECPGYADDVISMLGGRAVGDEVHVQVTNRLIFLARVVELGSRVRLVGPDELRDELRDMLMEVL